MGRSVITKEVGKLKYLEESDLVHVPHITDESIVNLVNGCRNLLEIQFNSSLGLTDLSLFSIAANCPQLEMISLNYDAVNMTIRGLNE